MLDTIESNVVYDHNKHGEVLVTAIGEMYNTYNVPEASGKGNGPVPPADGRLVYYYSRFDGYGGMNPTPLTQHVTEFAKEAEKIRAHERLGSDLMEE